MDGWEWKKGQLVIALGHAKRADRESGDIIENGQKRK